MLACIVAAASCTRGAGDLPPRDTSLTAADGALVQARVYPVRGQRAPGLVLVHDAGRDASAWGPFAARAQQKGFCAVAVTLRGHGGSTSAPGQPASHRDFTGQDWAACLNDLAAAEKHLRDLGCDPLRIAVAGEGLGGSLALSYCLLHKDIGAVIIVSPLLDEAGIDTRRVAAAYGKRPLLLLAAEGDAYAVSACSAVKKASPGLCEIRQYSGSAHGTALFDASDTAMEESFLWLGQMMPGPAR